MRNIPGKVISLKINVKSLSLSGGFSWVVRAKHGENITETSLVTLA